LRGKKKELERDRAEVSARRLRRRSLRGIRLKT